MFINCDIVSIILNIRPLPHLPLTLAASRIPSWCPCRLPLTARLPFDTLNLSNFPCKEPKS